MATDPTPKISALFYIEGHGLDTGECTRMIGLEPTYDWPDPVPKGRYATGERYIRPPSWGYELPKVRSYSVSEVMESLLAKLWPHRKVIRKILENLGPQGIGAGFNVSVTIHEDRPIYDLSAEVVSQIHYFRVGFMMDIF